MIFMWIQSVLEALKALASMRSMSMSSGKYQYDEWQISMSMSKKKYDKYENEQWKVRA